MKPFGFVIMGVAGSGKTVVGRAVAGSLGWDFFDADDFHPPANIAKMSDGIPLSDADRAPWLAALHDRLSSSLAAGHHPVLACSALKEKYRRQLLDGNAGIQIVHLTGTYELIRSRMSARPGHYMKPDMLAGQFETLEKPAGALTLDVARPMDEIVQAIVALAKRR